jgi:hypothetical protein
MSSACPPDMLAPAGTPCPGAGELCSSAACNSAGACVPAPGPQPVCKGSWKWTKGAVTANAEFGDPTASTDYALCIYDTTAGTPSLALAAMVPAGGTCGGKACWKATKAGFEYANKDGSFDGITKVTLREGLLPEKAKVSVQGKGVNLPLPALPLAQDPQVTVQLKNRTGACWTANFSVAIENHAARFKARSD